ncbi:putative proton-dependent oligopeptide transporter family, MFS transporter superfamily [Dioscorea sansibarensis]
MRSRLNMVAYLVREMHQSLPHAATRVNDWIGAAFILTILGAFLANAYLGKIPQHRLFSLSFTLLCCLLDLRGFSGGR